MFFYLTLHAKIVDNNTLNHRYKLMPLNLPDKLPAIELLKEENIFVIDNSRATQQDIRPLRLVILNLMPLKITTETDLVRLLSNTHENQEPYFQKYTGGAHEDFLHRF